MITVINKYIAKEWLIMVLYCRQWPQSNCYICSTFNPNSYRMDNAYATNCIG